MENNPSFIKNIIAILIGIILVDTGFLSHWFDLTQIKTALIGGYFSLSIYHGFLFGARKFGDLFSAVMVWLLPFLGVFLVFISLLVGMIVCIPKTIYSGYVFRLNRRSQFERL